MDVIWGSTAQYSEIAWGWPIAVYLFLAGLSAGALMTALIVKRLHTGDEGAWDGLVKAGAILAPVTIIIGQVLLIFDLGKPLAFYLLLFHYQLASVMSIGVILLAVYTPLSVLFAVVVFKDELDGFSLAGRVAEKLGQGWFELVCGVLAVAIASYTGFLLSAIVAKPLLNIAVLPLLFLVSGLSAGIAASILLAAACFRGEIGDGKLRQLLGTDHRLLLFELFVLFLLFTGLHYHGGSYAEVAGKALTVGVWAKVFWLGVVGLGLILPLAISTFSLHSARFGPAAAQAELAATAASRAYPLGLLLANALLVLMGGVLLRFYVLYAGQLFF